MTGDRPSTDRGRIGRWALLVAVVGADAWWLALGPRPDTSTRWVPLGAALGLHTVLVVAEWRRPALDRRAVIGATVAAVAVAVALTPRGSDDVWLYAMYGRMVETHHANPFLVAPGAFPGDPMLANVEVAWRDTRATYGPAFVALSAAGAAGFGTSALAARLFFQVVAGSALVGSVALLASRRVSTAALVFVGLAPALLAVVNGAHNDLLAGAVLVGAVVLVQDRRPLVAGVVAGLAVALKAVVAPAVLAVVVALALRRRWPDAVRFGVAAAVVVGAAYLAAGGAEALEPLATQAEVGSRSSVWTSLRFLAVERDGPGADWLGGPEGARRAALVAAVVAFAGFALRNRRTAEPAAFAAAALAATLLAATYVLPWYSAAVLPVAALAGRRLLAAVVSAQAAVLLVAYVQPPGTLIADGALTPEALVRLAVVQVTLLVVVATGVRGWRPRGDQRRRSWRSPSGTSPTTARGPVGASGRSGTAQAPASEEESVPAPRSTSRQPSSVSTDSDSPSSSTTSSTTDSSPG